MTGLTDRQVLAFGKTAALAVLVPSIIVPIMFTMKLVDDAHTPMGRIVATAPLSALLLPLLVCVLFVTAGG